MYVVFDLECLNRTKINVNFKLVKKLMTLLKPSKYQRQKKKGVSQVKPIWAKVLLLTIEDD